MVETSPFAKATTVESESIITVELKKHPGISADSIEQAFSPMVSMLREFEAEYGIVTSKEINAETVEQAKNLRLKMVKVRTGTDKIHKDQKAYFLRGGRAIDAVKNILEAAVIDKENKLSDIENHFINIEKAARLKLLHDRIDIIYPYVGEDAKTIPLADMSVDAFNNLHNGYKLNHEAKIKADREAEQKRIAEAEAKAIEEKQIREANKMLIRLNERIELLSNIGFVWHEMSTSYHHYGIEKGIQKDRIFKMNEDEFNFLYSELKQMDLVFMTRELDKKKEIEKERKRQDDIALENQRKLNEKFKKEQAERKRLEAEAQAQAMAIASEKLAKAAAERKLKRAPDREKLLDFANQISLIGCNPLKDEEAQRIFKHANDLLSKVQIYIITNTEKL